MSNQPAALDAELLRWICDPAILDFDSTANVPPVTEIIGQPLAREALEFGLDCPAHGQNIYVRGISGTGRLTMVRQMLKQHKPSNRRMVDHCYVHNFQQPDRPRLLTVPFGTGKQLNRRSRELAEYVTNDLSDAMNRPLMQATRKAIQQQAQDRIKTLTEPFEQKLAADDLALVQMQTPQGAQSMILPSLDGQPVPLEQLGQLVASGRISEEQHQLLIERMEHYAGELPEISRQMGLIVRESTEQIHSYNEKQLKKLLNDYINPIRAQFTDHAELNQHLDQLIDDVVDHVLTRGDKEYDPFSRYQVNVLVKNRNEQAPLVIERNPTLANLLGTIETQWYAGGQPGSDFRGVRAGSLLQADGGFLVVDAHDILAEPGAWKILMRTLRSGQLEIVPSEFNSAYAPVSLKPEPIEVDIRVILLGSHQLFYSLDAYDNDFTQQFKVLADFDSSMMRSTESVRQYGSVIAHLVNTERLRHFTNCGVAAIAEHGARIADRREQLTTRFGRIADLVREASWLAGKQGADLVNGDAVRQTVARTKTRASLPSTRFQSLMQEGTVHIESSGETVGQINGLAVISAGPLKYGFPSRITATISPGHGGLISIEDRASMSGSIHTKGFHILGGLLRHLIQANHPLAFTASIAFEQSYGGIDGDSASGAEICCLLSALTGVPIRQDLAMTGAVDQHGRIEAIGGVNEKIEGFYDICDHFGLTGTQGVIIPASNAGDLMLRQDLVEAARAGRFHVYAVHDVKQALALLTGMQAGDSVDGRYPEDSLLGVAQQQVRAYWEETIRGPQVVQSEAQEESAEQPVVKVDSDKNTGDDDSE